MKESNSQTMFKRWVENTCHLFAHESMAWELKIEKSKSFRFGKVSDNQLESLLAVKRVGLYHKINDLPVYAGSKTRFAKPKPFDCFFLKGGAYIAIWFYKPRQKKVMYIITIDSFVKTKKLFIDKGRKSIKEKELAEISGMFEF